MRQNQPVKKLIFAVITASIVLSGCGGPTTSSMGGSVSLSSTSADTNSRIDASSQSSQANENGMMTLEEVKAIYGPLLEKANTVQATYMWPGTLMLVSLPKGTVVQYGDTTFSLPYDYYLADDPRFGLDRCHSLADLRDLTEVAYTPECAERAYYNRYLVGSDPKFIEYEGELYALDCEGTEYVEFELDTLRIREQKENTIVAEIICWEGDSEEPSTGIVPIKMTANGWRLDRAVFEVTSN